MILLFTLLFKQAVSQFFDFGVLWVGVGLRLLTIRTNVLIEGEANGPPAEGLNLVEIKQALSVDALYSLDELCRPPPSLFGSAPDDWLVLH